MPAMCGRYLLHADPRPATGKDPIPALGSPIMIGLALVADGFGTHVPKGCLCTAMVFSIFSECINMPYRRRQKPLYLRNLYGPEEQAPLFPGKSPGSMTLANQGKPS